MSHLLTQWVFWSLIVGALSALAYIIIFDYKNRQRRKKVLRRRDALLTKLAQQAERLGSDVPNGVDCSRGGTVL